MQYPSMARDFVAPSSTCQEPVKLNMELKLPSGILPDMPDFSLKYSAIWNHTPKKMQVHANLSPRSCIHHLNSKHALNLTGIYSIGYLLFKKIYSIGYLLFKKNLLVKSQNNHKILQRWTCYPITHVVCVTVKKMKYKALIFNVKMACHDVMFTQRKDLLK